MLLVNVMKSVYKHTWFRFDTSVSRLEVFISSTTRVTTHNTVIDSHRALRFSVTQINNNILGFGRGALQVINSAMINLTVLVIVHRNQYLIKPFSQILKPTHGY